MPATHTINGVFCLFSQGPVQRGSELVELTPVISAGPHHTQIVL